MDANSEEVNSMSFHQYAILIVRLLSVVAVRYVISFIRVSALNIASV